MITSRISKKVKKHVDKVEPADTARKRKKDPSNLKFYSGFKNGLRAGFDGLVLFMSHPELVKDIKDSFKPLMNGQLVYLALGVLLYVFLKDPAAGGVQNTFWVLVGAFWKWGRIISTIVALTLERKVRLNEQMFEAALRAKNARFASEVLRVEPQIVKGERLIKCVRIARLLAFRLAGTVIGMLLPGYRAAAMTVVKFVSIRPVLGTKFSAALAAVELLPQNLLMKSYLDEIMVFFGESLLDAFDLAKDSTRYYYKRIGTLQTREYFRARYHGYLTGMGFLYSLFLGVPFLGVWIGVVAECGAACVILDIVERNLEKNRRLALPGEESLRPKIS